LGQWVDRHMAALIVAAFVLGALLGWVLGPRAAPLDAVSGLFVRLIQMIVAPLIVATVVIGVHEAARQAEAGRIALGVALAFAGLTGVALAIGMGGALLLAPGAGLDLTAGAAAGVAPAPFAWTDIVPKNLVDALARGDTLQLVVFGLLFGWATVRAGDAGARVAEDLATFVAVLFALTRLLVRLAPPAAFAATAALVGGRGLDALAGFLLLGAVVLAGLAALALAVIPAYLLATGTPIRATWRLARAATLIGFATASGAAALPVAMDALAKGGVPPRVVGFVLPLGAVFNLTGSTLFVGAASLFLFQSAGRSLGAAELLSLFGLLFAVSKAIPAVPRGSLALIAAAVGGAGVPAEVVASGIGALLAIDALLDMSRTGVNVWGHCAVAAATGRRAAGAAPG